MLAYQEARGRFNRDDPIWVDPVAEGSTSVATGEVTVLVAASEEVIEGVGNVVAGVALIGLPIVLLAVAVLGQLR